MLKHSLTFLTSMVIASSASAAVITLDFEGLGDLDNVESFYGGGESGQGNSGEDFGVEFSDNALAIIDQDAGGNGNFGNEPTEDTILFFLTGTEATLTLEQGFTDGFSFFYSAINNPGNIDVYDDVAGTGNVIASLDLAVTPSQTGDPTGLFNVFVPIGIEFEGTARSIDFGGTIDQIGFDNITFGSVTPGDVGGEMPIDTPPPAMPVIPLPAGMPLMLAGLGALGLLRRRKT